jgi:NDP-sugar pyrophosphorylase family protein
MASGDPTDIRRAVILAGGKGSRLAPYTAVIPKPLLPIGDEAILDLVLRQLRDFGFGDITLAVGHLAHLIQAVIGDGAKRGLTIDYHEEDQPLGTVGPLATIDRLDKPFLVMNGDVLTSLDYGDLMDAHVASGNLLTIACHRRTVKIDFGVLHLGEEPARTVPITGFEEKPELGYTVSMGVYVFDPAALEYVDDGAYMDLPDLVLRLIEAGRPVGSYLFDGYWLDIGRHDDYERANAEFESVKATLLRPSAADPAPAR